MNVLHSAICVLMDDVRMYLGHSDVSVTKDTSLTPMVETALASIMFG